MCIPIYKYQHPSWAKMQLDFCGSSQSLPAALQMNHSHGFFLVSPKVKKSHPCGILRSYKPTSKATPKIAGNRGNSPKTVPDISVQQTHDDLVALTWTWFHQKLPVPGCIWNMAALFWCTVSESVARADASKVWPSTPEFCSKKQQPNHSMSQVKLAFLTVWAKMKWFIPGITW